MATADELVDVIDDDGHTIGVVTRHAIRKQRLPHRCTYVLVFNRCGEWFVHLRTATKDVYPSYWDVCVGGVLAAGETFEQGTLREIKEELGVDAMPEELFPFRYADERTTVQAMVYRLIHDGPFQLQAEEIVRGEFVPLTNVMRRIETEPFCPDGVAVLQTYITAAGHSLPALR
jgi:isopentenyldiphosphate isomerase